jgi:SM-20-related protein
MNTHFQLNDRLDVPALAANFHAHGRMEIRNFLSLGDAERLRDHLLERQDWKLVLNAGDQVYEMPRTALAQLGPEQRAELERRVTAAARHGFHYRYESIRVSDADAERRDGEPLLESFVIFMSSEPVLSLIRSITGDQNVCFADGQATAYSSGHFLTRHDDDVDGKHRRAAYVFGLQPDWRAEWGGLLMFHRPDGNIEEAFTPAMGALRLFKVPSPHSVSYVTPFAPEPRLSVTGWFRTERP